MDRWWSRAVSLGSWSWKPAPFLPQEQGVFGGLDAERCCKGIACMRGRNFWLFMPCQLSDFQDLWFSEKEKRIFPSHFYTSVRLRMSFSLRNFLRGLPQSRTKASAVANVSCAIYEHKSECYLYPISPWLQQQSQSEQKQSMSISVFRNGPWPVI